MSRQTQKDIDAALESLERQFGDLRRQPLQKFPLKHGDSQVKPRRVKFRKSGPSAVWK